MLSKDNKIQSGADSVNNQAQTINNNYSGLTYGDVKELCLDLFEANFISVRADAAKIATERATEITEKALVRLKEEDPELLNEFAKPNMQDSFFNAQKAYAISEDGDLANMLVEMLINRAKASDKNRQRIVYDESLKVAPKLTGDQMDLLTLIHFSHLVKFGNILDTNELISKMINLYSLVNTIDVDQINDDLTIMEVLGLGTNSLGSYHPVGKIFKDNYPAYFMKGFTLDELNAPELADSDIFIQCFHDTEKYQFRSESKEDLIEDLKRYSLVDERLSNIVSYFDNFIMQESEIIGYVEGRLPDFKKFNSIYNSSKIPQFIINPVGITIALSNYQRRFGDKSNLSLWIK